MQLQKCNTRLLPQRSARWAAKQGKPPSVLCMPPLSKPSSRLAKCTQPIVLPLSLLCVCLRMHMLARCQWKNGLAAVPQRPVQATFLGPKSPHASFDSCRAQQAISVLHCCCRIMAVNQAALPPEPMQAFPVDPARVEEEVGFPMMRFKEADFQPGTACTDLSLAPCEL